MGFIANPPIGFAANPPIGLAPMAGFGPPIVEVFSPLNPFFIAPP